MERRQIVVLCSILLSAGVLVSQKAFDRPRTDVLRIAFPYAKPASAYEPALIHLAPEYIFLENVFSPLVEMEPKKGEIVPGVAEAYRWEGEELHLTIRKNLKTVTGVPVTAADAEFSLKRLLTMPGNTHGNFRELLCGHNGLKSVNDQCEGIRAEGGELVLKTTPAGKTFLLPMLVTLDFAIIPRGSVDPKTLKIADFTNTSGPYYVAKDSETGELELKANPNHYHYSRTMPQEIHFVPSTSNSLEDFKAGRVDYISTVDAARADEVIEFSRSNSEAVLHTTMNIRSFILTFTRRGQREIPPEQRFALGQRIRMALWDALAGRNGYEKSMQFFPSFGEGALDQDRMQKIGAKFDAAGALPARPLRLALVRLGNAEKFVSAIKAAAPEIDAYESPKNPNFMKFTNPEDEPQLILSGPDTGFQEDIGLITYSLNAGYFGMTEAERKAWLVRYMDTLEKADRIDLLKSLHESVLSTPVIVPLLVAPYAAIARKPWKIGLSQLYANNQLWLIQAN